MKDDVNIEDIVGTCKRGHPKIPENIYSFVGPSGNIWNECRVCKKRIKRKKEKAFRNK